MVLEPSGLDLRNKIVLMYHDIYCDSPSESGFNTTGSNYYKLDKESFVKQIEYIKSHNLDEKVLLTFDDGGSSLYYTVAPILESVGLCGVMCIPTDYIGEDGFLNSAQIRELSERGHIIAAHSSSHPYNMTKLSNEANRSEWVGSIERLNSILNKQISVISIPNGFYSINDLNIVRSLGITYIFTSRPHYYQKNVDQFIKGRIPISSATKFSRLKRILRSPLYRKFIDFRQLVLDFVKSLLGDKIYKYLKSLLRKI